MEKKTGIEVVGVVGVIASLLFVGVQVQQSAEATRAATVLQLKDNWVQLNLTQMQSPEVLDAMALADTTAYEAIDYRTRVLLTAMYRAGTCQRQWDTLRD